MNDCESFSVMHTDGEIKNYFIDIGEDSLEFRLLNIDQNNVYTLYRKSDTGCGYVINVTEEVYNEEKTNGIPSATHS